MITESIFIIILQSNPKHQKLWTAFLLISRNWFVLGTYRIHTLPRLNGRYGTVGDHYYYTNQTTGAWFTSKYQYSKA